MADNNTGSTLSPYGVASSSILGGVSSSNFNHLGKAGYNFIPTLYAGQLLVKFYESSVLSVIANTDYEGQIKSQGDSIIIRTTPNITIKDHTKGMTLVNEYPELSSLTMNINKGKYYAFVTDDVDEAQTDIKSYISTFTSEAAYHMRNTIEKDVLAGITADVGLKETVRGIDLGKLDGGDPATSEIIGLTKDTILDKIIECGQLLDENNVPEDGRFFLLPPSLIKLLKLSELKQANLTGDSVTPLRNGQVGMIDRFTIYSTNNIKTDVHDAAESDAPNENVVSGVKDNNGGSGSVTSATAAGFKNCLFGHKAGLSFASQMTKSESMVNPDGFGTLHRGLQVYGYKVVKPEAIGNLYCYDATT
ncbi:MAG: putative minor capsid protein 10B [Prokaryotic dsDNA virus sp.]|nr:MAG: putative minor capsid protein 10B [Prokaryotic dsDNA virus sp.]|tara:strand:- start:1863 stop:2948 length:1086 start_codon:yes stop_codon:yes gene_type:complete